MQMFLFASFWIYLRMRRRGFSLGMWVACLVCYCLALLSKTNAAMFPLVVYLYEMTLGRERPWSVRALLRPIPFGLCVLALLGFTKYYLQFSDYDMVVERSGHLSYAAAQLQHHVFHYLSNFAWPYPIRQDPGVEVVVWKQALGAVCLLASWVAAFAWWRRAPLFAFCVLAYQAMLVPTSSVLPLWAEVVAYRPYSASVYSCFGRLSRGLSLRHCSMPARAASVNGRGLVFWVGQRFAANSACARGLRIAAGARALAPL